MSRVVLNNRKVRSFMLSMVQTTIFALGNDISEETIEGIQVEDAGRCL